MANQNDSFIDEVTEDLRRDRLFLLMRRYGWIVIAAILVIVGAAAWREYAQSRDQARAERFGDALLAAEEGADPAARSSALAAVPAAPGGQATLRDLLAANQQAEAGNVAGAAAQYESAATAAGDAVNRDLARLKSVIAQGAAMDAATRDAVLADLSKPGAPFELLALELKAEALAGADRTQDAVNLIRQIQQRDGLSEAMRRRLSELMITLGVDPDPAEQAAPDPSRAAEMMPAQRPAGD